MSIAHQCKKMIKKMIKKIFAAGLENHAAQPQNTAVEQLNLLCQYRIMKHLLPAEALPALSDVGFKVFSQFEEDGLLLYIFALIGTTNKQAVELCAGNGEECMAANLVVNHGWNALLFDGDENLAAHSRKFYSSHVNTWLYPPKIVQAWITRENINSLISDNGVSGEIDLFSLDMDGNDYWVFQALNVISPRVIICETHNVIPPDRALTVPYKEDFSRDLTLPDYCSVSLLAMQKLCKEKGYRLIGGHRYGFNAIFMRNDVGQDYFPEVSVESVVDNGYSAHARTVRWDKVKNFPWVEV